MKDSSKETPVMPRPAPAPTPQPTHAAAVQDVSSEDEQKTSAVTTLESFGLSRADAVAIVSQHGAGHVVERVNALGPRARSAKNPPGFIRSSMGWPLARVPEPQERAEDAVKATRVKIASQQAMQAAHATWRATVDARLAELDPETEAELFEQAESRATSVYGRASHTLVQVAMRELVAERFGIEMPVDERSEKWP